MMKKVKVFLESVGKTLVLWWNNIVSGFKGSALYILLVLNWIMVFVSGSLLICCAMKIINQNELFLFYVLFNSVVIVVILNHLINKERLLK